MNPTTMTPSEIDTQLADLYGQERQADHQRNVAVDGMHSDLGHRRQYSRRGGRGYYSESADQTVAATRAALVEATRPGYELRQMQRHLDRYDEAVAELARIAAETAPLEAEYRTRPWSRFFTVQQSGGHIHSSRHCSTCNRGFEPTAFLWNPELSGLTEAAAVDKLGPHLCTVCYPSAPVEHTQGVADDTTCAGAGQAPVEGSVRRNWSSAWGKCTGCGETQMVTSRGVVRKHKKAKTTAA
jgi:hypothetical protein